jgi:hypothetical protein
MSESDPKEPNGSGTAPERLPAGGDEGARGAGDFTVFYAWQSDLPTRDNRNFIESALESALKNIHRTDSIQRSPRLDKDTKGVAGIPDIAATILEKIRAADAFVADVSFVGSTSPHGGAGGAAVSAGERMPNPNVMIELGYALSELGWERIILVLNTATGKPEELPFDLRNRRWPFLYEVRPEAGQDARTEAKRALTTQLESGVYAIARVAPRRKRSTIESRVDALETMVSALSGSLSKEVTLRGLIGELRSSPGGGGRKADGPRTKCQISRDELIKRVSAGDFHNVIFRQGMFVMVICPASVPSPLPLFEGANEQMLKLGLQPLSATSWGSRHYGDRFVTSTRTREGAEAATEVTSAGVVSAASHDVMVITASFFALSGQKPPADTVPIPSVAFEKKVIEGAFEYIKVLTALGCGGPWHVGVGLVNLKRSFLYTDPRLQFGGGAFEGEQILPEIAEIPADTALENPQGVARALRPAFDYVWREHGFPRSLDYVNTGDWVGGH